MRITHLEISDFRNISSATLDPGSGVNIIYGANAQGKTNLLEAVWLCSGNRSFRGAREKEMTRFGTEAFHIRLSFADRERTQQISYDLVKGRDRKKILLNRMPLGAASDLNGEFTCVVFHPEDLSLVKDGPTERRAFLDIAISQIKPVYARYLSQYNGILEQRNALLKDLRFRANPKAGKELLSVWDEQLSKIGTAIAILRQDYLLKLSGLAEEVYSGFTGNQETFSLAYESSVFPKGVPLKTYSEELIALYREKLSEHLEEDIRMRFTGVGIHRDDLDIAVNGISARAYGSQGQQRSCAIALKIGEAMMLKGVTGENPVILLDDVMSELDPGRQDYLLNRIGGYQVFITCCDPGWMTQLVGGKVFHVSGGTFRTDEPGEPDEPDENQKKEEEDGNVSAHRG